jgi:hypothetical protein
MIRLGLWSDHARRRPARLGRQLAAFHEHRAQAPLRQLVRQRAAGEAAADDDDVRGRPPGRYCARRAQ